MNACNNRRAFVRHRGAGCGCRTGRGRVVDAVVCWSAKSSAPGRTGTGGTLTGGPRLGRAPRSI